ncbi:MAG: acetyltransferase [Planctomycetes bacterium]|nr:acetyltransferase [Planctomycetota bacterium]
MKRNYYIHPLKVVKEFHECEQIQKTVWRFEDREIIPVNELITISRNGGIVLGAFTELGRMIGFVFGFAGIRKPKGGKNQLIHSSRMLAVLPQYRNSDIGYRLKLAQRAAAMKQGIKLMAWTFDPLQSLNAHFNINKLGIIAREYYINLYGTSSSVLNKGLETDRFLAEWWLNKEFKCLNVQKIGRLSEDAVINHTGFNKKGLLVCGKPRLNLKGKLLFAEIPPEIKSIQNKNLSLAKDWRAKTRAIFTAYFSKGYMVSGFIRMRKHSLTPVKKSPINRSRTEIERGSFYVLTKTAVRNG